MAERTQISLRLDKDLLESIRLRCRSEGISQTDFITNAIKAALATPLSQRETAEIDERIAAHLLPLQEELAQLRAAYDLWGMAQLKVEQVDSKSESEKTKELLEISELEAIRNRILTKLNIAKQAHAYKAVNKALDAFIEELRS
jgi:hypothetical protein